MIRGCTFDNQHLWSEDLAHEMNHFFQGKTGVTRGCGISFNSTLNKIVLADGYFAIKGRLLKNIGNTLIDIPPAGTSEFAYCTVVYEIDLSKTNTDIAFNQGSFKMLIGASAYSNLIQQDIDNGGFIYQMPICKFIHKSLWTSGVVDARPMLNMSMYALATIENPTEPVLNTPWVNYNEATNAKLGYWKDSFGVVHLRGTVTGGQTSMTSKIFQLPFGYRPKKNLNQVVSMYKDNNMSVCNIKISRDGIGDIDSGAVIIDAVGMAWVDLNGISFRTDI